MHFVIGSDGSEASKRAFDLAVSFFKTGDHVTVVHVSDPSKDPASLPFDYRATSIEDYFRTRCPVSLDFQVVPFLTHRL